MLKNQYYISEYESIKGIKITLCQDKIESNCIYLGIEKPKKDFYYLSIKNSIIVLTFTREDGLITQYKIDRRFSAKRFSENRYRNIPNLIIDLLKEGKLNSNPQLYYQSKNILYKKDSNNNLIKLDNETHRFAKQQKYYYI